MRRAATLDAVAILQGIADQPSGHDEETAAATSTILDATGELLGRHGLGRWSVDDVATIAGVGRATVYRRFASREDLINATLSRDLRRFFAAVADAVAGSETLDAKVVEGFLVGVRVARGTLLPELLRNDAAAALRLLGSAPVIPLGRAALVAQYDALYGPVVGVEPRAELELVSEALIRLALSFLLFPESAVDFDDETAARPALQRLVRPLLEAAPAAAPRR